MLCIYTVFMPATSKPKLYNPRHPERTLLTKRWPSITRPELDLASAGQFDGQGDHRSPKPYVRQAFARCTWMASLPTAAHCPLRRLRTRLSGGSTREARGVCPRAPAAHGQRQRHLTDNLPHASAPVGAVGSSNGCATTCNTDRGLEHGVAHLPTRHCANLQTNSHGAACGQAAPHIGAVAFIHRFGSV